MDPFRLAILSPLPEGRAITWIDLNPDVIALSWSTGVGGYVMGSVGYRIQGQPARVGVLPHPVEVPSLATVQIWAQSENGFLCFEGRKQKSTYLGGLRTNRIQAAGFGTSGGALGDDWFAIPEAFAKTKTVDDVERTALALLYRMVPATTDILRLGDRDQVTDPGGAYAPRQQAGRYLGQAIDQIVKAGVGGGQELLFAVYEDRRIQLRIIEPPLDDDGRFDPDYRISSDKRVEVEVDDSRLVGEAAAEYTPPGEPKQTTPTKPVEGWADSYGGLSRSMLIPTSAISTAQALQVRDRWLRRYSVPVLNGTFTIEQNDEGIENRYGQPTTYYTVRYGQWIDWGGEPFFITGTQTDASSKKTTVNFINVPLSTGELG